MKDQKMVVSKVSALALAAILSAGSASAQLNSGYISAANTSPSVILDDFNNYGSGSWTSLLGDNSAATDTQSYGSGSKVFYWATGVNQFTFTWSPSTGLETLNLVNSSYNVTTTYTTSYSTPVDYLQLSLFARAKNGGGQGNNGGLADNFSVSGLTVTAANSDIVLGSTTLSIAANGGSQNNYLISGDLANGFTLAGTVNLNSPLTDYSGNQNDKFVATLGNVAVPEPATYGLLAGAGLLAISLCNQYRQKQA
jgi:hypothetical protein